MANTPERNRGARFGGRANCNHLAVRGGWTHALRLSLYRDLVSALASI